MATRFEIVLHGENPVALRAAGEEALDEIERVEALQGSTGTPARFPTSTPARPASRWWAPPPVFRLLELARRLSEETGGAFDITLAPLVRCWGFMGGTGQMPSPEAVAAAREKVGWGLVELDRSNFTVRFAREGVMLDLGAIGKGYAVEHAAEILGEDGVTSAILHGGTSTVHAVGRPPDADAWKVAIERPVDEIPRRRLRFWPPCRSTTRRFPSPLFGAAPSRAEASHMAM